MPVRDSAACEWLKSAIFGHSPYRRQWLLNAESSHPKGNWPYLDTDLERPFQKTLPKETVLLVP